MILGWKKEGGFLKGAHCGLFYPFSGYHLCKTQKKIKRLNKRIRRLENKLKGKSRHV